jgi:hypothetical protein
VPKEDDDDEAALATAPSAPVGSAAGLPSERELLDGGADANLDRDDDFARPEAAFEDAEDDGLEDDSFPDDGEETL